MTAALAAYASMFASAFLAATILPFYSEILFVGLHQTGHPALPLWLAATAGNTGGALVNWALGYYLVHFQDRRWFPFKPGRLGRAQGWYQRWGVWSLLLSWAPVGGDALTFIAGLMRTRLWLFLLLTVISKGGRYAVLLAALEGIRWLG